MLPIEKLPDNQIEAVFSDLDGTLTDEPGGLSGTTYQAICDLKSAGFSLVIVSGRPAGWADALMRLWPIDAMVFENGAGILVRAEQKLKTITFAPIEQKAQLEKIYRELKKKIPQIKLASDQPFRRFDYAIDYAEEPPFLSPDDVELALAMLAKHSEITAKLSSIHINYWLGTHTKVEACNYLIEKQLLKPGLNANSVLYCGDSPNDEPLFEHFLHSVGVANIQNYLHRMKSEPRYVTKGTSGQGFCEITTWLLKQARQGFPTSDEK